MRARTSHRNTGRRKRRVPGSLRHRRRNAFALGLKLRATITGCRVHVMECDEAVCQGAAILAGVAAGVYTRIADGVDRVVREKVVVEPDARLAASYAGQLQQYRRLCAALKTLRSANSHAPTEKEKL